MSNKTNFLPEHMPYIAEVRRGYYNLTPYRLGWAIGKARASVECPYKPGSRAEKSYLLGVYCASREWLGGYHPPDIDARGGFAKWSNAWSMGPSADDDWVWFNGGYYTEEEAREVLRKKELRKSDEQE